MINLKNLGIFFLLIVILFVVVGIGLCDGTDYNLKMMTGSAGGIWFPTGSAIAEIIQKNVDGVKITVVPGGGVSNLVALQNGSTDFGFGKSPTTFDAIKGNDPFNEPGTKIRNMIFLMQEVLQIVVPENSDINSIDDLRDKIVITAAKGSSVELMLRQILEVHGLSYQDFANIYFVSFSDAAAIMKDKKADAWILSTSLPASTVMDLASARKIRLVSLDNKEMLDKISELNSAYVAKEIPSGSYKFMEESITAICTSLHLAVSSDLPEDLVYKMVKAISENVDQLGYVHVMYKILTPEKLAQDIGVPFHPGALKYYNEVGLTK